MKKLLPICMIGLVLIGLSFIVGSYYQEAHATSQKNVIDYKPRRWWKLNSDGHSQKYVELKGESIQQRTEEFLFHYDIDNYNEWEVIGRLHEVKTEMIVCIAYADSSLGKSLKTKNNIGNVGNNDRGDEVSYSSLLKGINAIGKVLNNRYLGHYNELWQMSRYGNKDGMVYATSTENWHINVQNCLGMIYDSKIPNSFEFRR